MIEDDDYYVKFQSETTRKVGNTYEDGWWITFHDNVTNSDAQVWVPSSQYPASVATAIKAKIEDMRYVHSLGTGGPTT